MTQMTRVFTDFFSSLQDDKREIRVNQLNQSNQWSMVSYIIEVEPYLSKLGAKVKKTVEIPYK